MTVLLIAAILVQALAYPFLLQKATFGAISALSIKDANPKKNRSDATESETKAIASYAAGLRRTLSWQLKGHEKNVFDISEKYLKDPPLVFVSQFFSISVGHANLCI